MRPRSVSKPLWLVLPDQLSTRVFFDCGIVELLAEELGPSLRLVFLLPPEEGAEWAGRMPGVAATQRLDLFPWRPSLPERAHRLLDRWLDRQIGFYPLALRHSLRHGFHRERMRPGHRNWFLDPSRAGPLPRWQWLDPWMRRWHYGRLRYVPSALRAALVRERPTVVLSNVQMQSVVPVIVAARRLALACVGYVASWDHPLGKGIVCPHLRRYLVQNQAMREDLVRYHGIEPSRIVVTGWPQTDLYYRRRPRADYEDLVRGYGLDPGRPLVMVMGNTPTNAPYEPRLVERLVAWWEEEGRDRLQLLFRPHPRDREWRQRFAAALGKPGTYVQEPSFTDLEALATLLQHGSCVVANAGTILLDALVNDRPAVCVLYDEGAPSGERFAATNALGEHYRALMRSRAFYRAERFEEVVAGIERALAHPEELAEERRRVALEVVGEVDGRAAERVVEAIVAAR